MLGIGAGERQHLVFDNAIVVIEFYLTTGYDGACTVCTRAIITRCLYTFYPLFEVHLFTVTFGLMYDKYSRAISNQERVIVVLYGTYFSDLLIGMNNWQKQL